MHTISNFTSQISQLANTMSDIIFVTDLNMIYQSADLTVDLSSTYLNIFLNKCDPDLGEIYKYSTVCCAA